MGSGGQYSGHVTCLDQFEASLPVLTREGRGAYTINVKIGGLTALSNSSGINNLSTFSYNNIYWLRKEFKESQSSSSSFLVLGLSHVGLRHL